MGGHVSPSYPHLPGPSLCQESGNHSPHFLDQLSVDMEGQLSAWTEC